MLVEAGSGDDVGSLDWERVRLSEPSEWEEESQVVNFEHPCPPGTSPTLLFTPIVFVCRPPDPGLGRVCAAVQYLRCDLRVPIGPAVVAMRETTCACVGVE